MTRPGATGPAGACPRCGSDNTDTNVTTDIPGDGRHDYGCNECLFVWDAPNKRLRYVCQADGCGEGFATARGFRTHAADEHDEPEDVRAERLWVDPDGDLPATPAAEPGVDQGDGPRTAARGGGGGGGDP